MIKANTEIRRSVYDDMKLHGSVLIDVPKQLKPMAKTVLTYELGEILKTLDKIDHDIITEAMKILIKEVQNEQN